MMVAAAAPVTPMAGMGPSPKIRTGSRAILTNEEMINALLATIGRPSKVAAPVLALKLAMGELADVLLASQRVVPSRLLTSGFEFRYPQLKGAWENLLHKETNP